MIQSQPLLRLFRRERVPVLAMVLAMLTFAGAGVAALALVQPNLPVGDHLGLAEVHERRATALLAQASPSAEDLVRAASETRRSLALAPANPRPWLRLAYIESRQAGGLTVTGLRHLERSYVLAPHGPDDSSWRLAFMFQHWDRLTPALRRLALSELALQDRKTAEQVVAQVSNPEGRVALSVMLARP